jgi:tripartite-type tricarboxylate transporter receptor subunit TctC
MKGPRCSKLVVLGAIAWIAMAAGGAAATAEDDDYPNRAVRMVVPYQAGATTDTLGRILALKLEGKWKQSVYVENLAGGGGLNGAANVARSPADGYTFVIVTASHVILPAIMSRPPFDPIRNFAPVTMLVKSPGLLLSSKQSGIDSFAAMVKRGREVELSYGTSGVGSKHHVSMAELARLAGIKTQHISYRGSAQAMNDVLGGHLPLQMGAMSFANEFVRKGQVNGLAIVAEKRHAMLPDVPTLVELGYPLTSSEWWVLLAPAGTPAAILDKVAADAADVLRMPEVKERMPADELVSSTPGQLLEFLKSELETWGRTAKQAGIVID